MEAPSVAANLSEAVQRFQTSVAKRWFGRMGSSLFGNREWNGVSVKAVTNWEWNGIWKSSRRYETRKMVIPYTGAIWGRECLTSPRKADSAQEQRVLLVTDPGLVELPPIVRIIEILEEAEVSIPLQ